MNRNRIETTSIRGRFLAEHTMDAEYQRTINIYLQLRIRYNCQKETWECQQCNYRENESQGARTIGDIASEHGHAARRLTKRWDAPREDQLRPENEN